MAEGFFRRAWRLIQLNRSHVIARRYFVVNGFDGALTMLGLLLGFSFSTPSEPAVVLAACLGAAIALAMSGFSSAYISESAERQLEFRQLQNSMISDLRDSAHARASRWSPLLIAAVNSLSPLLMSLLIMLPLWLTERGYTLPFEPLLAGIAIAFGLIFLLGAFLGVISGTFWLWSGLKTLAVATITTLAIYAFV